MIKRHKKSRPARPLFTAAPLPVSQPVGYAPADNIPVDNIPADNARKDGWTPERRARFLELFGVCGIVGTAADAVGLSRRAAYDLRARDPEFARAWDAARFVSRQVMIDEAVSTAFEGRRVQLFQEGEQVGERLHNSASMVYSVVHRIRSKKLLGNAHVMAAALHFERCMELLGAGIAFPDPDHEGDTAPVLPAPAGWSPAEQVAFCRALYDCGSVLHACDAIGKPRSSAYAARHHAGGKAFAIAWDAALYGASELLLDLAMELTCKGAIDITVRRGKLPVKKRTICPNGRAKAGLWLTKILVPHEEDLLHPKTRRERERALGPTFDRIESGEAQAEIEAADAARAAEKAAQARGATAG